MIYSLNIFASPSIAPKIIREESDILNRCVKDNGMTQRAEFDSVHLFECLALSTLQWRLLPCTDDHRSHLHSLSYFLDCFRFRTEQLENGNEKTKAGTYHSLLPGRNVDGRIPKREKIDFYLDRRCNEASSDFFNRSGQPFAVAFFNYHTTASLSETQPGDGGRIRLPIDA